MDVGKSIEARNAHIAQRAHTVFNIGGRIEIRNIGNARHDPIRADARDQVLRMAGALSQRV